MILIPTFRWQEGVNEKKKRRGWDAIDKKKDFFFLQMAAPDGWSARPKWMKFFEKKKKKVAGGTWWSLQRRHIRASSFNKTVDKSIKRLIRPTWGGNAVGLLKLHGFKSETFPLGEEMAAFSTFPLSHYFH